MSHNHTAQTRVAATIQWGVLLVLLVIVGLRPLISESYDSEGLRMTAALSDVRDPNPATTLLIDGAIILAAIAWLAAKSLQPNDGYRKCGIEWGLALIAIAATVSCVFASNQRLAINGAVDWVSCGLLSILLVQVLRDSRHVHVALAVILATSAAQAVECLDQVYYSFEQTEAMYQKEKEAFWSRQGVDLDSPQVDLFERRMQAREASGYLAHSNIAGAYLGLCGLVAVGVVASAFRSPMTRCSWLSVLWPLAVAGTILFAASLTHSRGALAACLGAFGLMWLRFRFACFYRTHRRAVVGCCLVACVVLAMGFVTYGSIHGSFPDRSLDFRWKYWQASARMVADSPLTGVGRENFGRHYLQYKTVESPEEVKNPHNVLVSAATDWGIGGFIGLVSLLWGAGRRIVGPTAAESVFRCDAEPPGRSVVPWAIILAASIFGIRWTLLGSDNPHYRFYVTVVPLIVWLLAFAAVIKADIGRWTTCATVLGFALVAFVLQDLVNFASTIPATLTTAFAVLGVTIATLGAPARRELRRSTIRPFVVMPVAGIIAMVYFIGLYWPVGQMNAWLQSARTAATPNVSLDRYEHAVVSDKLDPTPCFEFARWLRADWNSLPNRGFALDRATVSIELAIARDPLNVALYREKALCFRLRGHEMKSERDLSVAVDAAREAVALYPTDPDGYILLADCLVMLDQARNDVATLNFAVQSYEKAIAQDNSRPEWEEIQRLTPAQRQTIQTRISETQAKVHSRHH